MSPAGVLLAWIGIAFAATAACAHERSAGYSEWTVDADGASVELRIDGRDLTRPPAAAGGAAAVDRAIAETLVASRGGRPCPPVAPPSRSSQPGGRFLLRWRVACPAAGPFAIDSGLPALLAVPHLAFARIHVDGGDHEAVLHADRPRWQQPALPSSRRGPAFADSFRLGLSHIAGGIDHLFFLVGLVVAAVTLGEVAVVVTAFTTAHALTLAAATLGLLRAAAPAVEALIAVSIALLAVENLTLRAGGTRRPATAAALVLAPALAAAAAGLGRVAFLPLAGTTVFAIAYLGLAARYPDRRSLRWLVAFAFGLLHGFGFAGALVESGFAGSTVALTLLAFHAGVEAGQLLLVAALWPLLQAARRRGTAAYARLVLEPASVLLLAGAVGWYAVRSFG